MKGVSPIISTVLMIAIAIAAAVVVYYVTMNIVSGTGSQAEQQATAGQDIIQIEGISVSGTTITAYVRNMSKVSVEINNAYILKPDGTVDCTGTISSGPVTISGGSVSSLTITASCISSGNTYQLKLVTKNGGTAVKTFTA